MSCDRGTPNEKAHGTADLYPAVTLHGKRRVEMPPPLGLPVNHSNDQ